MAKRRKIANSARQRASRAATRTGAWKTRFLAALAETGNVTESAARANVDRKTAQLHHQEDRDFAERWADALEVYADGLEGVADHRARHGVEELKLFEGAPVFVLLSPGGRVIRRYEPGDKVPKGCAVAPVTIRRPSDALLMKLLAARRPEKYRERVQVTHDGKLDGPRTPAERAGEAAALLAELREQLGPDPGPAPAG